MKTIPTPRRRQRGFITAEAAISSLILLSALGVATTLTMATVDLTQESHVLERAHTEHRRNLLALGNHLRTASIDSLEGFDAAGVATRPGFQGLLGVGIHDRQYTDPLCLEWRPTSAPVNGVDGPGAIWLVGEDDETLVASRVPAKGFVVRQEGGTLAIRLTTYYSTDSNHTCQITSETAVNIRN